MSNPGVTVTDGDTFSLTAGGTFTKTFQFQNTSTLGTGNIAIAYKLTDSAATVAADIATAINGSVLNSAVSASVAGGNVVLAGLASRSSGHHTPVSCGVLDRQ